jgi:hypothetical protein
VDFACVAVISIAFACVAVISIARKRTGELIRCYTGETRTKAKAGLKINNLKIVHGGGLCLCSRDFNRQVNRQPTTNN